MIYPLAPKPRAKPLQTQVAENPNDAPMTDDEMNAAEAPMTDEEMNAASAPAAPPPEPDPYAAADAAYDRNSKDPTQFMGKDGEFHKRTLDLQDRTRGAVLGMMEAPLFHFNDEIMGTLSALGEQGQSAFGLMPKGQRARTVREGIADAKRDQDRYAAARDSGEIGFWDADNVASNAVGTAAGVLAPFEALYNGAKWTGQTVQHMIPFTRIADPKLLTPLQKAMYGFYDTAYGLAGSGAAAAEIDQAGHAEGDPGERAKSVVKAGALPMMLGAAFGLGGGALGYGGGKMLQGGFNAALPTVRAAGLRLAEILNDAEVPLEQIALQHGDNLVIKPDVTLAEAGPDPFRGWQTEGGVVARSQGSKDIAAQTLLERQRGSTRRVAKDIADDFGADGNFKTTFDGLKKSAQEKSQPLYEEAYAKPPIQSAKLYRLINSVTGRKMMQAALDVMEASPDAQTPMVVTNAAGRIIGWPTQAIQYMKQGLDNMISREFQVEARPAIANAYKDFKNRLLSEVDTLNPAYGEARAAYAGEMEAKDAIEAGYQNAYAHPAELNAKMLEFKTPSEREFFNRGMAQRRLNDVRTTPHGANVGAKMLNSDAKVDSGQWALGEKYHPHARKMELEQRMTDSYNEVYGNSKTAERLQAAEDSKAQSAEEMFSGAFEPITEPTQWIKSQGMTMIGKALRFFDKGKRTELAKMLFSRNPDQQASAISIIQSMMDRAKQQKANMGNFTATPGQIGSVAGQSAAVKDIKDNQGF